MIFIIVVTYTQNYKELPTGLGKVFYLHWPLVFLILVVGCFGFLMLYSVADGDYEKWSKPQLERFLIGFVIMLMMGCVGIDFWRACSPFIYFLGVLLLISVFFLVIMEEVLKDG